MEDPFVAVMDPVVTCLRTAVEEISAFEVVDSGVLYRERFTLAMGVACRRREGQLHDLTLELRCSRTHLPDGRGWMAGTCGGTAGRMLRKPAQLSTKRPRP